MTNAMLPHQFDEVNMGGIGFFAQQNPTGRRRLGHVGAVSGGLWIFAQLVGCFRQQEARRSEF